MICRLQEMNIGIPFIRYYIIFSLLVMMHTSPVHSLLTLPRTNRQQFLFLIWYRWQRHEHEFYSTTGRNDVDEKQNLAREKRKALIGLAKAVDRGYSVPYAPGGTIRGKPNYHALSGLPDRRKPFTVLGIESSCDDTGAAIITSNGVILGEALASQRDIHEKWGGVVPGLARDEHVANIDVVIQQALSSAGFSSVSEIDAIGVTVGPGLEICLRVGATKAIELAQQYNKPFVGIHHLEAHILMARLPYATNDRHNLLNTHESVTNMQFPFLSLLVSGGHCLLLKCCGIGDYTVIGGTLDDSLGEAYDKTARLLGLPIGGGGGPAIEKLAAKGNPKAYLFSVPMQTRKDCDFSFAGLKTNVRRTTEKLLEERNITSVADLLEADKANVAASFQYTAIKHVEQRLSRAMDLLEPEGIRTLALVGGVAANKELRSRVETLCSARTHPWTLHVPPPRLCTDQGAMSAWAAIERLMVGSSDDPSNQQVFARYPFAIMQNTDATVQ